MNDYTDRDEQISDLILRAEMAEAEVARLKAHTWEQERTAAVAWLTAMAARYVGVNDVVPSHVVSALAKNMAGGLHWITEGGSP